MKEIHVKGMNHAYIHPYSIRIRADLYKVTTVRLSDETIKALENLTETLQREKSDLMREALQIGIREIKLLHAIDQYRARKISFGRMSELSGLGYRELYAELRKRNIPQRYGETRFREEINQLVD